MSDSSAPRPTGFIELTKRLKSPWTLSVVLIAGVALLDPGNLGQISSIASKAFLKTLPFILVAVLLIGYLKASGAETLIGRAFEGREVMAVLLAAAIGGLAPFCSCQVIPFVAGLIALGAPLSAIMAFWLASPLIDPPTLLITAAALGWPFAIAKAVSAVALGLFGGYVTLGLLRAGRLKDIARPRAKPKCGSCCAPNPASGRPHWTIWDTPARRDTFRAETLENLVFLVKWLVLAYVLEALLIEYVPANLVAGLVGGEGVVPIAISAFVGMPAYLNSYVAPPLLAGLMEQGMSAGAALAFMVAGAVSSVPAMAAVWALVKPRVFALYLGLGVSGAIIAGLVFQALI